MSVDPPAPRFGVYGLRLTGAESATPLLVPAPASWPTVRLQLVGPHHIPVEVVDRQHVEVPFDEHSGMVLDRVRGTAAFHMAGPLSDAELIHPYLSLVGATWAWWCGHDSFHAGAFVAGGGVWALLGGKESGKSTTLAALSLAGHDIFCDDLLVLGGGVAVAGPRCIDLRTQAAEHLQAGERLDVYGPRERWRMPLSPVEAELPFRGWVFLEWGEAVETVSVSVAERLPRLAAQRSLLRQPADPTGLLDLAALPAWQIRRPPGWGSLAATVDQVLEATLES